MCPTCGAQVTAGTGFCPSCGAPATGGLEGQQSWPPSFGGETTDAPLGALTPIRPPSGSVWKLAISISALLATVVVTTALRMPQNQVSAVQAEVAAPAAQVAAVPVQQPPQANPQLPEEILRKPETTAALKALLRTQYADFEESDSFGAPPTITADSITSTACAPRSCGESESTIGLFFDGRLVAGILRNGVLTIYGAPLGRLEDTPGGFQDWVRDSRQHGARIVFSPASATIPVSAEPQAPLAPLAPEPPLQP